MKVLSETELSRMQAHAEESMWDACYLLAYAAGNIDDYGKPTPGWTAGWEIACGYSGKSREVMVDAQVVLTDGVLRLPIDTVVDARDRLQLIKRHGEDVTPLTFEILGTPARGPSGLVVNLKLVTDGST
jgi:hypothetical protein